MCILYTTICLLFLSYAFLDGFLFGTPYMTENNIKIKLAIAYLFPDYISLGQLFFNGWLILECIVFVVLSTYLCGFCVSESLLHCSTFEYTVPLIRDWFHHLFFFLSHFRWTWMHMQCYSGVKLQVSSNNTLSFILFCINPFFYWTLVSF